ncbi:2-isopropylmalate synthase [Thermogemmatispora tikiterensis]|uniref:2-isopropylmalate synthase n=1 Tax=Thermogemmatispora tikiterensis TaxID=1825093 RepID=A0A328VJE5_9CHLR|nr:2-isopropylmalate synthase [Thermogemmatispora tikiterensis]RAQ95224.1 2-isopropylmalate synthase [Thermogemmatispora tikiterensis]
MGDPSVIRVFDTTLRDGEQSPGATMTTEEKLQVAEQLVRLNVDIIEAGFPAASPGDLAAVKAIAQRVRGHDVAVAGLARANTEDIDAAWEAVREADQPVIHVFLATSDIHLKYKLRITPEEALEQVKTMVTYARNLCPRVEFSAEDATRSDWDYLCRVFELAIKAGATTINVPDTVGYVMPHEYEMLFRYLRERVPGMDEVVLSAHCHDDLGLATANTLAAIRGGARQVEVTINGIGERAGNTAMEEVVMALRTRPDVFQADTRINAREFVAASQLVSRLTGIPVQPNKAIVGQNAFAHEAGIHQDGVLKNRLTYEIMTPQSVGWDDTRLVLGKHSGRHGLDARLRQLGYRLNAEQLKKAYARFIALADEKKYVTDDDLIYIVESSLETPSAI